MLKFWSTLPQKINPVAFQFGELKLLWYSLSYILAFFVIYCFLKQQTKKHPAHAKETFKSTKPLEMIEIFFLYCILGLFFGAKIGFILFYDFSNFLSNPITSISPFTDNRFVGFSGLSFHGGVIGIALAGFYFCKRYSLKFFAVANFIILAIPLGYFWGRIGNFLNGELYGRITHSSLGMCFSKNNFCEEGKRHPSQLYEAFGEGIVLFLILWYLNKTNFGKKYLFSFWLIFYGLIRFMLEFLREPDVKIGLTVLNLTIGQLLCFCMIIIGLSIIYFGSKQKNNN